MFPKQVVEFHLFISQDAVWAANRLLSKCFDYRVDERICADAIVTNSSLMRALCQLENSIVDIWSADLSDGFVYCTAFSVNDRCVAFFHITYRILYMLLVCI